MRFAAEHDVPARPGARTSGRALRSPPSHATMPGALTAHTEPNSITCRRVVPAGIPLPATMRYATADNHSGPNGRPAHSRLPNGRQPRCEVMVATTAREQMIRVAAGGASADSLARPKIAFRLSAYLCAKWNTHSRVLHLACDRRRVFSIVLIGNQIADSACPTSGPEVRRRCTICTARSPPLPDPL